MFRKNRSLAIALLGGMIAAGSVSAEPVVVYRATKTTVVPLVGENVPLASSNDEVSTPVVVAAPASSSLSVSAGQAWTVSMAVSGGSPSSVAANAYTFTVTPPLSSGLTASTKGSAFTIVGTAPTGSYGPYTVVAKDSKNVVGTSAPFSVVVAPAVSKLYAFGSNLKGNFGDGTKTGGGSAPSPVAAGESYASLTIGNYFSCGLKSGKAWCWGWNPYGQIGLGSPSGTDSAIPVAVDDTRTFSSLSASSHQVCGLDPTGRAWCWGRNNGLQLGVPTIAKSSKPVAESTGQHFDMISVGDTHVCGLDAGKALCWGSIFDTVAHTPWTVGNAMTFKTISSGYAGTCGVTSDDKVYCWGGSNYYGMLGDNNTNGGVVPRPITTSQVFTTLSVGYGHTCGLTQAGNVWCWGYNSAGQLGTGATAGTKSNVPVLADASRTYTAIAAGFDHTCGISGRKMYCWGGNGNGVGGRAGGSTSTPTVESTQRAFTNVVISADQFTVGFSD